MSSAEPLQQQSWPDLDVSYFRWEPPVFPSVPAGPADAQQQPQQQSAQGGAGPPPRSRVESAFAHSDFPATFAGWDRLRAASDAEQHRAEALAGRASGEPAASAQTSLQWARSAGFGSTASAPLQDAFHAAPDPPGTVPGFPVHGFQLPLGRPPRSSQEPGSAFTSVRGDRPGGLPVSAGARAFSFDPPGLRMPAFSLPGASSGPAPMVLQCGSFTAPVQQDGAAHGGGGSSAPGWVPQQRQQQQQPARPSGARTARSKAPALPPILSDDPLQLQEYYTAQSDMLEELMRGRGGAPREPGYPPAGPLGGEGGEAQADFLDSLAPMFLGRAASVLDVPRMQQPPSRGGSGGGGEPYMPQWQSESVPAELPNHVVNRLLMGGLPSLPKSRGGSLSGSKRDWLGQLQTPAADLPGASNGAAPGLHDGPDSPKMEQLEELVKTADMGVAHRAFLVPPHKKRGKGGRQPAADPRLDPTIDARKAKRILANRLSAARSKLRQKSQMDNLGGMVKSLEEHRKLLGEDAAELMEVCEETEFGNRRLARQVQVLEEYVRRQGLQHAGLQRQHAGLLEDAASRPSSSQEERSAEPAKAEGQELGSQDACMPRASTAAAASEHPGSLLMSRMAADLEGVDCMFDMPH